jgi:hypothetical protein
MECLSVAGLCIRMRTRVPGCRLGSSWTFKHCVLRFQWSVLCLCHDPSYRNRLHAWTKVFTEAAAVSLRVHIGYTPQQLEYLRSTVTKTCKQIPDNSWYCFTEQETVILCAFLLDMLRRFSKQAWDGKVILVQYYGIWHAYNIVRSRPVARRRLYSGRC